MATGKLTTRFGGVVIEKNAELDPIYAATGQVRVTNIPAGQRNIIGVLKGRDPVLRNTYVLVTAHYDHIGEKKDATGDTIYNGANDNASSVSALIEIARAMAAAPVKPRRSVVFMAYFGEERGLVGSRYYAAHPVFPDRENLRAGQPGATGPNGRCRRSATKSRNAHRMGSLGSGNNPGGRREAARDPYLQA